MSINFSLRRMSVAILTLVGLLLPLTEALSSDSPLRVEGHADFFQRVLSLPDARLLAEPDGSVTGEPVPIFTIYYVFERRDNGGDAWLRVGRRPDRLDGWIKGDYTQTWKNMLVLQFAPPGQRERVLFFQRKREFKQLLKQTGRDRSDAMSLYYDLIEEERAPRGVFAAIEPPFDVAQGRRAGGSGDYRYLLPILDWDSERRFKYGARSGESGPDTTLVQVAMINTKDHQVVDPDSAEGREGMAESGGRLNPELRNAKIGVVFVIDTTASMGPYIERVRRLVRKVYDRLADSPYHDKIRYGLVAYRDDVSYNPWIGYLTKVFQPLDPNAPPARILENLRRVAPSPVSTRGWDEDAFAGLHLAISEDWWEPFKARLVFLVTDAGARPLADPHASVRADASTLRTLANEKNIAIIPMHLETQQAQNEGNIDIAAGQYRVLGDTGDRNRNKYRPIEVGDPKRFSNSLDEMSESMLDVLDQWSRGAATERSENPDSDAGLILNELFRAQVQYLGERHGQEISRFYTGWAADRDLVDPANQSFTINLLLTRNQLSGLAGAVDRLLGKMHAAETGPEDFLDQVQGLAATLSVDPNRDTATGAPRKLGDTLPSWLSQIPYHSDILLLTSEDWLQQGAQQRNLYTDQLEAKNEIYRALERDSDRWIRRGGAEELGLLGLEDLP